VAGRLAGLYWCADRRYGGSVDQAAAEAFVFEESPDITGRGGREIDPGKPAGKCHRNKPPMGPSHVNGLQARVKWCGKSAPALR
jgi:hypothetical protein